MRGQEGAGDAQAVASRPVAQLVGLTVIGVGREQVVAGGDDSAADDSGGHCAPAMLARAAAYSAARCSVDRWT